MKLSTGQLKHLLDIERTVAGRANEFGEKADTAGNAHSVVGRGWFSIETLTQAESVTASANERTATHRLRCYYDPTIRLDSSYRLRQDARIFDIISAINIDEDNREWELIVGELQHG